MADTNAKFEIYLERTKLHNNNKSSHLLEKNRSLSYMSLVALILLQFFQTQILYIF